MDIAQIRQEQVRLEQDVLERIRYFEDETTVIVKKIKMFRATNPQEFPQKKTISIDVSTSLN